MEFFLAVVVPVIVVLACGVVRTIARRAYRHGDYCLGMDLTLAGLAAVIAYSVELKKRFDAAHINGVQYADASVKINGWMVCGIIFLGVVLLIHQGFEDRLRLVDEPAQEGKSRPEWSFWSHPVFWLLVIANGVGIGYMASFLHLVRTMP